MGEATVQDGVPVTGGWFVLNARDARWLHNEMRSVCRFGGEGDAHFDDLGVALYRLGPGQAMSIYHHEAGQEDFLVLQGSCLLVIEGHERRLQTWDLVHCPPRTPHTIVTGAAESALLLAVGARKEKGSVRYPFDETAVRRGAGAERETGSPAEAYARFSTPQPGPAPDVF